MSEGHGLELTGDLVEIRLRFGPYASQGSCQTYGDRKNGPAYCGAVSYE